MSSTKAGLAKQVIMSSAYWTLNKNMVQMFGLESAMLLSTFAEAESMLSDEDGWFYQTTNTVEEITTLSRHKQDKCIRKLIGLGVLQQDNKGMPMKRYFRIDYEVLATLLADFQQTGQTQVKEPVTEVEEEEEIEVDDENIEKCQFVKNQQPTLLKTDNLFCQKSATINNIYKESNDKEKIDDSLRSSLTVEETETKEKDLVPTKLESKALVKDSKYSKNETKDISLDSVVQLASQKSIERRNAKSKVPRKAPQNANTIVAYFGEKFKETLGGMPPLELGKDRKLMKQMIEHYGYDTVKVYIDWMFRNWAKFRRDCKLNGVPTIGMLYGFRSYLQEQNMYTEEIETEEGDNVWGV
jgi:hypothetical protein